MSHLIILFYRLFLCAGVDTVTASGHAPVSTQGRVDTNLVITIYFVDSLITSMLYGSIAIGTALVESDESEDILKFKINESSSMMKIQRTMI
jgi:hypothetical protein